MRKSWSKQEDQKLIDYINIHGEGSWTSLPKAAGLQRCGKSCRLRWMKYLRPREGNFRADEEDLIIKLHALLGNRWSLIAGRLPGRTEKEVNKYWNSHMKRELVSMGIDPNNHRLNQKLSPSSGDRHQPHLKDAKSSVADSADSVNGDDAAVITSPNVPIPFRPTSSFSPSLEMLAVRRS